MQKFENICDQIIKFGLIVFALGMGISISVMEIGLYIFIFLPWLAKQIIHWRNPFSKNVYTLPIILYLFAAIISTYFAYDRNIALYSWKHLGKLIILFVLPQVMSDLNQYKNVFKISIAVATLNAGLGIYQFFGIGINRADGTSFYMTLGGILMILVIVGYALVLESIREKRYFQSTFLGISLSIIVGGLIFTFTRNAWIGCIIGLFIITMLNTKPLTKTIISLLAIIFIALTLTTFPAIRHRAKTIFNPKDGSNQERILMWRAGVKNLPKYFVTGIGMANASLFFERCQIKEITTRCHMHNNFLQIILELGFVGLVAFCWLLFAGYRGGIKIMKTGQQRSWGVLLISVFTAFLVAGMFEFNFGDTEVVTLVLVLLSSVAIKKLHTNYE